jgi:hypothetical protein
MAKQAGKREVMVRAAGASERLNCKPGVGRLRLRNRKGPVVLLAGAITGTCQLERRSVLTTEGRLPASPPLMKENRK